jgi:uncharacterized SAM-binding protein YcdF (DUF218 family)
MLHRLFQRRTIWWPTLLGWAGLFLLLGAPLLLWWFRGEAFLSHTERQPADVLVVEGWIGIDGIRAAKAEFDRGGYRYIITAGGQFHYRWGTQRWNYAEEAREILVRAGAPSDKVIEARATNSDNQRTFESAVGVRRMLEKRGLHPAAVNVFTLGVHARRSRLVFAKALPPGTAVGVISWTPPDYQPVEPWWKSTERADDMIKETTGYLFEALLNSGRGSNSPAQPPS